MTTFTPRLVRNTKSADEFCPVTSLRPSSPLSISDIIPAATVRTVHRRGKSMSRRTGQNGTVEERNGAWRGRYLVDVAGQAQRQKRSVVLGFKKDMTKSEAKRKLKEIIRKEGIDLPTYVIPSTEGFAQRVELWE